MSSNLQKQLFLFESTTLKYLLYKKYLKIRRSVVNSIIYKDRLVFGEFFHLYPQFRKSETSFRSYTRMTTDIFDYILKLISPEFDLKTTNF